MYMFLCVCTCMHFQNSLGFYHLKSEKLIIVLCFSYPTNIHRQSSYLLEILQNHHFLHANRRVPGYLLSSPVAPSAGTFGSSASRGTPSRELWYSSFDLIFLFLVLYF